MRKSGKFINDELSETLMLCLPHSVWLPLSSWAIPEPSIVSVGYTLFFAQI